MQISFSRDNNLTDNRDSFNEKKDSLIDPLAKNLANKIQWFHLNGISSEKNDLYPVGIVGKGSPVLLIHGFDSCFLEFRRLVPFLENFHKLIIPDLYGFGFCPRPKDTGYGIKNIILHLNKVIEKTTSDRNIGVIGASMGGGIAMQLARENMNKINRLLLLCPAGLTGEAKPVPKPLDKLGVCFLKNKFVRKQLCKNAFANPKESVGEQEEQIASIHLNVPGWSRSLAAFANAGGVANCGLPLPNQQLDILWGAKDKIISKSEKDASIKLVKCSHQEIDECGHLPHLDVPEIVANKWLK